MELNKFDNREKFIGVFWIVVPSGDGTRGHHAGGAPARAHARWCLVTGGDLSPRTYHSHYCVTINNHHWRSTDEFYPFHLQNLHHNHTNTLAPTSLGYSSVVSVKVFVSVCKVCFTWTWNFISYWHYYKTFYSKFKVSQRAIERIMLDISLLDRVPINKVEERYRPTRMKHCLDEISRKIMARVMMILYYILY